MRQGYRCWHSMMKQETFSDLITSIKRLAKSPLHQLLGPWQDDSNGTSKSKTASGAQPGDQEIKDSKD